MSGGDEGRRKDGKPYRAGNTGEDGTYLTGYGRPPEATRFAKDDGRPRGRRKKGGKNLRTMWQEELSEKLTIVENGQPRRITKIRAVIKQATSQALKGRERSQENVLRNAAEVFHEKDRVSSAADHEIVSTWLQQLGVNLITPAGKIGDDQGGG